MFAIANNNKVILGPCSWNKGFFTTILRQKKITHGFIPLKPVDELPYELNETTKIFPVEVVHEPINEFIQYHTGPFWEIKDNVAIATYEPTEQNIVFAKQNYKNLLSEKRYEKEIAGAKVTVQDTEITLDTTRDGRNAYVQKYTLMQDGDTINWKFPEGWMSLNKTEFKSILDAVDHHVQTTFNWEKTIYTQIDAETLVADLVKYKDIIEEKENT